MRCIALMTLLAMLLSVPAQAQIGSTGVFRVDSPILDTELVLEGVNVKESSPAPLILPPLEPGRYRLYLYRHGEELDSVHIEATDQISLSYRRTSRALTSTLVPGFGQYRDFGFWAAIVPFGTVFTALGLSLHYGNEMRNAETVRDGFVAAVPPGERNTPEYFAALDHFEDEVWVNERTRDNYAIYGAYLWVGNIFNASIHRSRYVLRLKGTSSVEAAYDPPGKGTLALQSILYPGLGHLRLGHRTRGTVWSLAAFAVGLTLVESQRKVDQKQVDLNDADRAVALDPTVDNLINQVRAQGELQDARGQRSSMLFIGLGVWALALADLAFVNNSPPVPTVDGGMIGMKDLKLQPGWDGSAPGLVVCASF